MFGTVGCLDRRWENVIVAEPEVVADSNNFSEVVSSGVVSQSREWVIETLLYCGIDIMISSSLSCRPVFLSPEQFSGESLFPLSSSVRFRQARPSVVPAAYASATAERESTTATCVLPAKLSTSFYEILGIPMGATSEEIKSAYRRLARVCHPDVAAIDRKTSSADEFMRIHAAYSTLSDPGKRAEYDRRFLRRQRTVGLYSTPSFSGYTGRNWETEIGRAHV